MYTHYSNGPALTEADIIEPAMTAESVFHSTSLGAATGPTVRKLADLAPRRLALMYGSSFSGDAPGALRALADRYDRRLRTMLDERDA